MKRTLLLCFTISLTIAPAASAEFQVNTRTSESQANPAIAMDANGDFIVVWNSYFGGDKSNDILGQRFGADGSAIGGEFQINTTTIGNQKEASVAMNAGGDFIVVWQGPGMDEEDIFAQRFDSNGQALGGEFCVSSDPNSKLLHPKVAMTGTGRFVIVWERKEFLEPFWVSDVVGRIYDSNAMPIGTELKVNVLSDSRYPDVAVDGDGNFTVVWMQDDIYHAYNLVMARQYDADGTAKTDPCEVSTTSFSSITQPSIAMDGAGQFVVVWDGHPGAASLDDVYARRYESDGTASGEQFVVNTTLAGAQQNPRVAVNSEGEFVIVWDSKIDPNINERNIFGQRYDSLSRPIGDEFQVNTYVVEDQKYPDIVMRENGEFVTVWQSYGQDGSKYGIFGEFGPRTACADATGDLFADLADYCVLADEWLKEQNPLKADLIDDNRIDEQDLDAFCKQWLTPCYECDKVDISSENRIDFRDYALWSADWLKQGPNLDGDVTGNGIVDAADLKALFFHWAETCE